MTPLWLKLLQIQNTTRSQAHTAWADYLAENEPHLASKKLRKRASLMDKIHNLQIQIFLSELWAAEYERIVWHKIYNNRKRHLECHAKMQDIYLYANA